MSTPNQERSQFEDELWDIYKQAEALFNDAWEVSTSKEIKQADEVKKTMLDLLHTIVTNNRSERVA